MRRLFVALLAGVFSTAAADAVSDREILQRISAAHILDACREAPGSSAYEEGECWGQIVMLYMLAFAADDYLGDASRFCPPDGASPAQTKKVVLKYIDERPERHHEPFAFLAVEALRKAWPCR